MLPLALVLAAAVDPPPVQPIVDGQDAAPCQWPSVVALVEEGGGQFCSGAIVAPRFVLTAGHCLDPAAGAPPVGRVLLGEDVGTPVHEIAVTTCAKHPDYEVIFDEQGLGSDIAYDIGYCLLEEDAPAVPRVPAAAGCEDDASVVGGEATIVGFGASAGGVMDGMKWAEGNGIKRFTTQSIEVVDTTKLEVVMFGGGSSACFGDSGGPMMIGLPDGSWRVFGVASTLHPDFPTDCGYGSTYELVTPHLAWLEQDSGVDITPCFDDRGGWAPQPDCGGFPLDPLATDPTWPRWCAGELSGPSESCAPPSGTEGSGGSSESTTDGADGTSESTGAPATSDASGSSDTSDTTAADDDAPASGCGCTAAAGAPGLLGLLGLLGAGRRRRARSGSSPSTVIVIDWKAGAGRLPTRLGGLAPPRGPDPPLSQLRAGCVPQLGPVWTLSQPSAALVPPPAPTRHRAFGVGFPEDDLLLPYHRRDRR